MDTFYWQVPDPLQRICFCNFIVTTPEMNDIFMLLRPSIKNIIVNCFCNQLPFQMYLCISQNHTQIVNYRAQYFLFASKPNGNLIFLLVSVTTNVDGEDIPQLHEMSRLRPKPMRLCFFTRSFYSSDNEKQLRLLLTRGIQYI